MPSAVRATALRPRATPGVPLSQLSTLIGSAWRSGAPDPQIWGATLDSRLVRAGDLYVALPGRAQHGARFAVDAVRDGAVAVLTDAAGAGLVEKLAVPLLVVDDPRAAMAPVAARVYGDPSRRLTMFGVTGTNGKTTTSFLLDAALRAAGRHTGVIGTIGFLLDGATLEATRTTVTTPESPELQALLAMLLDGGADAVVMEVSSHALVLGRADAITFDVVAFTNFGRDHLDFHGDEESYFEAKALLFTPERTRSAVISIDDPRGRVLLARLRAAGVPTVTLSLADDAADYRVLQMVLGDDGRTAVSVRTPDRTLDFRLALPGDFNVRNAVTALAMVDRVGLDLDQAARGLADAQVPGRMQRVELGAGAPAVFVDFAHTPQAVEAALSAVHGRRRVVVLGCGGDRDPDKRGPIGAAAALGAEVVVVTDDNPRSEEPAAIRAQVLSGARAAQQTAGSDVTILDGGDRRSAIRRGLELARGADVVMILGKGHETGQEIAGTVIPFSDVQTVREAWSELSAGVTR